jgi:phosphomannomutase/phosphoglucomutase
MIRKKPAPQAQAKKGVIKQLLLAVMGAVLITAVVLYNVWFWMIAPDNQHRFDQRIMDNIERYKHSVQAYVVRVKQPLQDIANNVPSDIMGSYKVDDWLADYRKTHHADIANIKTVTLFSLSEVEHLLALPSDLVEANNMRFIVIDMINRLQKGAPLFIEAARVSHDAAWELHSLFPVNDDQGNLLGVLHATLSLQGVEQLFHTVDPSFGRVSLTQSVEGEKELLFFSLGKGSSEFINKTRPIDHSHWRIAYQPSQLQYDNEQTIPWWFFVVALVVPLFFIALALYSLQQSGILRFGNASNNAQDSTQTPTQAPVTDACLAASESVVKQDTQTAVIPKDIVMKENTATHVHIDIPHSIFRAYDIRGFAHKQLSHDLVFAIGQAVATEVLAAGDSSMVVGYDARVHSAEYAACITEGIISTGCDVVSIGLVPTPLMNFSACQHPQTSSGVIITASHNPKEYNGCKMVVKGETLVDDDIQRLKARIIEGDVVSSSDKGSVSQEDYSQAYIDTIVNDVAVIDGWRVVVDAGNGAASELAPRVLSALQCTVTPLFCQFDGEFPNHDPDPSVIENLAALIEEVKSKKADIGFAFDGDGDRIMVVTASGKVLWPDQLLMLFAQDIVARNPGCDVVYDIKSSKLLADVIIENGGRPVMWKTGHSHIKAKMRETQALLGGEFSGHIFFKERWFGFDDGLYAAARLLELMTLTGQSIDHLFDQLPTTVSTPEIKVSIKEEQKFTFIEQLIAASNFPSGQVTVIDGLRVDFEEGWGLVRASNTAAVLTLRFEAANETALKKIQTIFKQELHKIDETLNIAF